MPQRRELNYDLPFPGDLPPAPETVAAPKDSATVVLLRDTSDGVEVFLQRRVAAMAFAAGMTVFPGGGVDSRDADESIDWAGPSASTWADWFGCSESVARELVCAAVRETFEESGVLLAGTADSIVTDTARYVGVRDALVRKEISLAGFLHEEGLTLRADLLRPWANWVTPEQEPRRYDTRFFLAALPEGQAADGRTTEAETTGWWLPADAIADAKAGNSRLMPPTWLTLSEMAEFGTTAEALAEQRSVAKFMPKLVRDGDQVRVLLEES